MKRLKITSTALFLLLLFVGTSLVALAQDAEKTELNVNLRYFLKNNKVPYLTVETNTKVERRFEAVEGTKVAVYISEIAPENLLANVVTDEKGKATVTIPPAKKDIWEASNQHTFIAIAEASKKFDETTTEIEITKARLEFATDTTDGARNIKVKLFALQEDNTWAPVEEAELKIGIQRLNAILPVVTDETYTTDADGLAVAEFTRANLPGDEKGNLTLVTNLEDSDMYGNLILEETVPWGVIVQHPNNFDKRSLFATRDKAPFWLLGLSAVIFFIVWGTIAYLVFLIIRIRNLGKARTISEPQPESEGIDLAAAVE
jgi:hypothetical protein